MNFEQRKIRAPGRVHGFGVCRRSGLAVGTQNVDDLVSDHVLNSLTGRLQVLAGIEVIGMLGKVLTDVTGHGQTDVGVDVDLADSQLGSLPELILGDADGVGHIAAVGIDHLHEFLGNGRGSVQHNGEAGQTLDYAMQHVEAQGRRNQNAVCIAGALGSLELHSLFLAQKIL